MEDIRTLTERISELDEEDFREMAYITMASVPPEVIARFIHENFEEYDLEGIISC